MGLRHVMLLSMLGMACALKCYEHSNCSGDCEPKEGQTCTGELCYKNYGENGDAKSTTRGCMPKSSGMTVGCEEQKEGDAKVKMCYCDGEELCNGAMATTGSVVITATAAILVARTLLW